MGCQLICQSSEVDSNQIIADTGSKTGSNKRVALSRNKNNHTKNQSSLFNSNYKCSINIQETFIDKDVLKINLKASNVHKMVPIWLEASSIVTFKVFGEWGFSEHHELFDSMGCSSFEEKPNNMNFGCLIGYIPGEQMFTVFNELNYTPKRDGPLFLFQNNGLYSVNPLNSLDIEIFGGTPMSIVEIEKKLGWDLEILDTSIPSMKEEEISLLVLMNKVRTNPRLFLDQYLINSGKQAEVELEQYLKKLEPLEPLKTSERLYDMSKTHALDLGKNNIAGHISSNGYNMEQRLQQSKIDSKVFAENCIFGYNDPIEIVLRLLIDEDNENRNQRKIILSPDFNMVGLAIEQHLGEFCWSCIQDFIMIL